MPFELFIAGRYLFAKKKHAFISLIGSLSVAGVALGVATLIAVIAVMTGTEQHFRSQLFGIQPHVLVMRQGGEFSDYPRVIAYAKSLDPVSAATPFIYTQIMLRSGSGIQGAVLKGVDPAGFGTTGARAAPPDIRRTLTASGKNGLPGLVLGGVLAEELGVRPGDRLYGTFPQGKGYSLTRLPRMRPFAVTGTFSSGLYEYDRATAYMHLKDAQKVLGLGETVSGVEIRLDRIFEADAVADALRRHLGPQYWARDWTGMNQNLFASLKLQKTVMFVIFSLIVLVAGFSITSTLIMTVIEKTRDIAILKAMGASNPNIARIFLFQGMAIAAVGAGLGTILGVGLALLLKNYQFIELPADVYYFSELPVQLAFWDIFAIILCTLLICMLSAIYPARRAARLDPAQGVRNL